MAAPIDLSTLNSKREEPSVAALSPEEQEALSKMAEEHPEAAGERVDTAFLVVYKDGRWMATPDVHFQVIPAREATTDDMYDGAHRVIRDIDISETAQAVVGFQQQLAMQMQQQAQAQRIAQGLHL